MNSNEIRHTFLNYFSERGHTIVPSSPVVPPKDDPTLLFTNAGMNQFKDVFLGKSSPTYKRAVSVQKCIRAGGKHNDLDNVGFTARHHTFFEMLGNFSFGDYFKAEAIQFGWEFTVTVLGLDKARLWITVYEEDRDAVGFWKKIAGIAESRIMKLGPEENFWAMGDTGPCGPCSEIILEQENVPACGTDCGIGKCSCDRFLELWNLVFMEFERDGAGRLTPLPKPSIDTGMGLERIAAVLQEVSTNFETDLMQPIILDIQGRAGKGADWRKDRVPFRVIADHIRTLTFALGDGVVPSNDGRGYVLRKILRRATRFGRKIGINEPFLYTLVPRVVAIMDGQYPELAGLREQVARIIFAEEERFQNTLTFGLEILQDIMSRLRREGGRVVSGKDAFLLYDTYGFPLDLAQEIVAEEGMSIDGAGFEKLMQEQRERAKAIGAAPREKDRDRYVAIKKKTGVTVFTGYESTESSSPVVALLSNGKACTSASEGMAVEVILKETPFYGEAGGQAGDTGRLHSENCELEVTGTRCPVAGLIVHQCRAKRGEVRQGDVLTATPDKARRLEIARHHTGTHLLQFALRQVLGDHVRQSGSLVAPDRFRFDFTHFTKVSQRELDRIEQLVNNKIREDAAVMISYRPADEIAGTDVIALFGEKYGDTVRVVGIGEYSKELCGGTHCTSTGTIGIFKILSESSVAAGIRRIEAVCGEAGYRDIKAGDKVLSDIGELLKTSRKDMVSRIAKLIEENKRLENELRRSAHQQIAVELEKMIGEAAVCRQVHILVKDMGDVDVELLRTTADIIQNRFSNKRHVTFLASTSEEKFNFILVLAQELTEQQIDARKIVESITSLSGGGGGGRRDMAQAGGKDAGRLKELIEKGEICSIIKKFLNKK